MTSDLSATATGTPGTAACQTAVKVHQKKKKEAEEALGHSIGVRLKLQIPAY